MNVCSVFFFLENELKFRDFMLNFSYTFVQETKFLDFYEGACHYDVTEAKRWAFGTYFGING